MEQHSDRHDVDIERAHSEARISEGEAAEAERAHLESQIEAEESRAARGQNLAGFKLSQIVIWIFGLLEGLLGLRVLLRLLAANPENPIAAFIFQVTALFIAPFQGLTLEPTAGEVVLEVPTVIAMAVYAILAWALVKLIEILLYRPVRT